MGNALHRILEEDLSLRFYRDPQTKEFLLGGSGQQHVEIVVSRLKKRYGVDVTLKAPKIPYRETIRGTRRRPGPAQEADRRTWPVRRLLDPHGAAAARREVRVRERDLRRLDSQKLYSGRGKRHYGSGRERLPGGIIRWSISAWSLYDGSYHDVDSSELSFKLAARKAFKDAMEEAKPALLEPIMNVEIQAPVEYAGDLMGD